MGAKNTLLADRTARSVRHTNNWTVECECGNRKGRQRQACDRCIELDGRTKATTLVIHTLRMIGSGTTIDVAEYTQTHHDVARRALKSLEKRGRVASSTTPVNRSTGTDPLVWWLRDPAGRRHGGTDGHQGKTRRGSGGHGGSDGIN